MLVSSGCTAVWQLYGHTVRLYGQTVVWTVYGHTVRQLHRQAAWIRRYRRHTITKVILSGSIYWLYQMVMSDRILLLFGEWLLVYLKSSASAHARRTDWETGREWRTRWARWELGNQQAFANFERQQVFSLKIAWLHPKWRSSACVTAIVYTHSQWTLWLADWRCRYSLGKIGRKKIGRRVFPKSFKESS